MTSDIPSWLVSTSQLASLLTITDRQVRNLATAGVIRRTGSGRKAFDASVCVPAYLNFTKAGGEHSADISAARLRLIDAQFHDLELRTREREKRVLPADEVAGMFEAAMTMIGSQLDALGRRFAPELAALTDPAIIQQRLFDETRRIRNAAADQLATLASSATGREGTPGTASAESRHVG